MSPRKPTLKKRLDTWYESGHDPAEAAELLAELVAKERKKKPANQGRRSRIKGQEEQRFIARALAPIYPDAHSCSQYRGGKREGSDVQGIPWFAEVKNCKTISMPLWLRQLEIDRTGCQTDLPLVLFFKIGGQRWAVTKLEEFVDGQRERVGAKRDPDGENTWWVYDGREIVGVIERGDGGFVGFLLSDDKTPFVSNPRKGSGGMWSTLDDAEAAIRREYRP